MSAQEPEASRVKEARNGIRAMDEAMTWLMRIRDGSLTERDLAEWTVWYESNDHHKRAFDEMQRFWIGAGTLADGAAGRERIQSLLDEGWNRPQTPPVPRTANRLLLPLALAASVGLLVFTILALAPKLLRRAPSSAALAPLARETLLPDGSKVELAPRSVLQVRYTPTERRVVLCTGEAYFSVIHDAARPFILSVNGLLIRDVGTTFNIRDADGRTVVTVVKGAIDVVSGAPSSGGGGKATAVRVTAGEQVGWDDREQPLLAEADVARALAWREGRLEYVGQPLSSVIADVNRYARRPVVVGDTAAGGILFTGTVFTRTADEWVQSLPNEFPVELISNGGASLVLASRPASPTPPGP
jgi:transmembrane sensor